MENNLGHSKKYTRSYGMSPDEMKEEHTPVQSLKC
jgi:hypothetical protein